jgi:hypothetical protein
MAGPQSSASQPTYSAKAGEHCPFLGVCDDPSIHYGFATPANCCHSAERPHSIEPSYQASTCLGTDWTECPRYLAATDPEAAQRGEVAAVQAPARRRLPVWALLAAVAVGALVLVGLYLVLTGPIPDRWLDPKHAGSGFRSDLISDGFADILQHPHDHTHCYGYAGATN